MHDVLSHSSLPLKHGTFSLEDPATCPLPTNQLKTTLLMLFGLKSSKKCPSGDAKKRSTLREMCMQLFFEKKESTISFFMGTHRYSLERFSIIKAFCRVISEEKRITVNHGKSHKSLFNSPERAISKISCKKSPPPLLPDANNKGGNFYKET